MDLISTDSQSFKNETFTLQGVKTNHRGEDIVILRLPKVGNVVGRFLVSYEEELNTSCTSVDYTTLWAILDDMEQYKPERADFVQEKQSIATLARQCDDTKNPKNKKVYDYHSITEDPCNTGGKKKFRPRKRKVLMKADKVMQVKKVRMSSKSQTRNKLKDEETEHVVKDDDAGVTEVMDTENEKESFDGASDMSDDAPHELKETKQQDEMDEFQQTSDDETVDTCDMSRTTDVTEPVDPQHVDHSYFTDQADTEQTQNYTKPTVRECPNCGEEKTRGYALHVANCKPIEMMCTECSIKFSGLQAMENHLSERHKGSSEHYCSDCDQAFITDIRLNQHEKIVHAKQEKCEACGEIIQGSENASVHQLNCVKARRHGCRECQRRFMTLGNLKSHKRSTGHEGFVCRPCELEFDDAELYAKHVNEDLGITNECRTCGKKFKRPIQLWKHEHYTHKKVEQMCHICGWKATRRDTFILHMKKHKTGGHVCDLCKISCMTPIKLNSHKVLHQPSACYVCNHVFLGPLVVRRHIRKMHPEVATKQPTRQFACLGCKLVVSNMEKARLHLDRKPSCREYHMCSYCGSIFHSVTEVAEHASLHTGPYLCFYCNRGFLEWDKCSQHMIEHVKIRGDETEMENDDKVQDVVRDDSDEQAESKEKDNQEEDVREEYENQDEIKDKDSEDDEQVKEKYQQIADFIKTLHYSE